MLLHASAVARGAEAVLLLGPPGSGKSDLALRLIRDGWFLVADDQCALRVEGANLFAEAPPALRGMLEVRGLGIFAGGLPLAEGGAAAVRLAVRLVPPAAVPRLPSPSAWTGAGVSVPEVALDAGPSAPAKVALALDAATGRVRQRAGAFA
jgi:HPr kinase/phosphorylase